VLPAVPAAAETPVRLTPELRAALAELAPLRGPAVTADGLTDRLVVVTFFASWCPPCYAEFRHLGQLLERRRGADLAVIAVNWFEDWGGADSARLARMLAGVHPKLSVVAGRERVVRAFDDVRRIPSLFVFDRVGREAYRFVHRRDAERTHVTVEDILAAIDPLG
jgi:thiol-disulfide isomerase/thioredoxin